MQPAPGAWTDYAPHVSVSAVDVSANGALLAIGGNDGLLRLYELADVLTNGAAADNLLLDVRGDPNAGEPGSAFNVNKVVFSFGLPGDVFPTATPSKSFLFAFAADHQRDHSGNGRVFQISCTGASCEVDGVRADASAFIDVDGTSVAFSPDSSFVAFGGDNFRRFRISLTLGTVEYERFGPNVAIFPIEVP